MGSVAGSVASSPAPIAPPPQTPWTPHKVWSDIGGDSLADSESNAGGDAVRQLATGRMVRFVLTERGKHDFIGLEEGLQDVIGRSFDLI